MLSQLTSCPAPTTQRYEVNELANYSSFELGDDLYTERYERHKPTILCVQFELHIKRG
jgi:hypothetical protein